MDARESAVRGLGREPPPKEQPPRNLSGQRTARPQDTLESVRRSLGEGGPPKG